MTNVATWDAGVIQEETFPAPAMFYYMKEWHYYRSLGIWAASQARCRVTEDNSNFTTVNEVWDKGVDGLIKKVHLVLLWLNFETFKTQFSVDYIPHDPEWKKGAYSDMIHVWGLDIAEKDPESVIAIVRDLVNKHLGESQ